MTQKDRKMAREQDGDQVMGKVSPEETEGGRRQGLKNGGGGTPSDQPCFAASRVRPRVSAAEIQALVEERLAELRA